MGENEEAIMSHMTVPLASLRFDGPRFDNHALDVDCVSELLAYKKLVLECAKELWYRKYPEREQLPRGFEERLTLEFSEIREGSAVVPLRRVVVDEQTALDFGDEFDEAAELIDAAIFAAHQDQLLPAEFPRNVIPLFRDFGKSLGELETLFVQARNRESAAPYTAKARGCLAEWTEATFDDLADVTGEVSMANIRGGTFELAVNAGPLVRGKFSETQEAEVLDALRAHKTAQLRVRGVGEFSITDRQLRKFISIDMATLVSPASPEFVENVKPIWETIAEMGASVPEEVWSQVPSDLGKRLDHYLYSNGESH
jgi:hypothetical protein